MHKQIRKRLTLAEGESEFVIAVNLDIRGFSAFSMRVDAVEAAQYLKSLYIKLLDDYFPDARFFKLTGDGLMLVFRYSEADLRPKAAAVLGTCKRVLANFPSLTASDEMVNFDVPTLVGIGIARGAACRIRAGRLTLDYSGRVLNLASRLMSLARPSGIVIDTAFGLDLVPTAMASTLSAEKVYLAGIAEEEPIPIVYTPEVELPPESLVPIRKLQWRRVSEEFTVREWRSRGPLYDIDLPSAPHDVSRIESHAAWTRKPTTTASKGFGTSLTIPNAQYLTEGDRHKVRLNAAEIVDVVLGTGVSLKTRVKVDITYPTRSRPKRRRNRTSPALEVLPEGETSTTST